MGGEAVAFTEPEHDKHKHPERFDQKLPARRFSTRLLEWSQRQFDAARVAAGHADDRTQWHRQDDKLR